MFRLSNDGYSMTFANGFTVSVRWHKYIHYVTDRILDSDTDAIAAMAMDSVDAEVAVLDSTGEFVETPFNNNSVIGWQPPDEVHEIMAWARALPHESHHE